MQDKLIQIMAVVFEMPVTEISDNSSMDTVENWDSLKHIQLMFALESEFGILLQADEMVEMTNFKAIVKTISEKIK
ncbi:MAG: acyl carrier protein [Methanospirillaceae archaeon]|nr:acyl carrier protein [Methanospirillaceae archaeon]